MSKIQNAVIKSIQARIDAAPNTNQVDNLSAELRFFSDKNGAIILDKVSTLIDIQALAKHIAVSDKSSSDFIAVYALQKIRKMVYSLANNTRSYIDGYSNSILSNMVSLQTEITNKSALVSLSKGIEYTETDKVQSIKRLISVAVSTASTQASSTRQMLRVLNIANVTKRKNADEFTFNDSDIARAVIAYYQV